MAGFAHFKRVYTLVAAVLSCMVVVSLGMHTVQLEHTHPGEADTHSTSERVVNVSEYVHATEEKLFLALLGLIAFGVLLRISIACSLTPNSFLLSEAYIARFRSTRWDENKKGNRYNYLSECFSSGILHPKLYNVVFMLRRYSSFTVKAIPN